MKINFCENAFHCCKLMNESLVGVAFLIILCCWWNMSYAQSVSLERGDVILSANGASVNSHAELTNVVNQSPQTMNFTVRDSRTGQVRNMQVTLNSSSPRFGVYSQAARGGGTMITGFTANAPALRCVLVGGGGSTTPLPQPRGNSNVVSLERGDIILSVNGKKVYDYDDTMQALYSSPLTMNMTIRDVRTQQERNLRVTLTQDHRLGILFQETRNGVVIINVTPNSPATRCIVVDTDPPPPNPSLIPNQPPDTSAPSKVYMLFVYGTEDKLAEPALKINEEKITRILNKVKENDPNLIAEPSILKGKDASPEKILKACNDILANARPKDACFIYITCHGTFVTSNNKHYLHPLAKSKYDINDGGVAITRDEIWNRITTHRHRLDVFITDACSVVKSAPPPPPPLFPTVSGSGSTSRVPNPIVIPNLYYLLKEGRGKISINSCKPDPEPGSPGELALWVIPKDGESSLDSFFGSVFVNAFDSVARKHCENGKYTPQQFFGDLKESLHKQYKSTFDYLFDNKEDFQEFVGQNTQTLEKYVLDSQ